MWKHTLQVVRLGPEPGQAGKVMIAVHGRGADAASIVGLARQLMDENASFLAPQAEQNSWYPYSFLAPPSQNEPALSSALEILNELVDKVVAAGINHSQIHFMGFSQGACLTLEYVTRNARRYGSVTAFTGGLIGDIIYPDNYQGSFDKTPVYIGSDDKDFHVPLTRIRESETVMRSMGAEVKVDIFPGMGHTVTPEELKNAQSWMQS